MKSSLIGGFVAASLLAAAPALAEDNIRGATYRSGHRSRLQPSRAIHPPQGCEARGQYVPGRSQHPEQQQATRDKLAALAAEDGQEAEHHDLPDGRRRLDGSRLQRRRRRHRQCDAHDGQARQRGPAAHVGLFDAVVLADAGDDPHRPEPAASRHPSPAHVRRARRARRCDHDAASIEATGLHHPGRRQVAHGREQGVAAAECRL